MSEWRSPITTYRYCCRIRDLSASVWIFKQDPELKSVADSLKDNPGRAHSHSPCLPRGTLLHSVTEEDRMSKPTYPVRGALDLLILKILALESFHCRAIGHA